MLRRIDRILFRVPQLESAVRYYRDVLDMKLVRHERKFALFQLADHQTELILHIDEDLPAEAGYFLVDDVRALFDKREALQLTFLQVPSQGARGFRATIRDPFGTVLQIVDHTGDPQSAHFDEASAAHGLFEGVELKTEPKRERLIRLYEKIGRTADDLPYTAHFESLYEPYIADQPEPKPSRAEVWRHLLNIRKAGKLPKLGDARSKAPEIDDQEKQKLIEFLGEDIGKRDRLPYTDRFNVIVDEFNKGRKRPLSPHQVWRVVATIAK